jgi:hypothetical protein
VFIVIDFVIDSVRKLLDISSYVCMCVCMHALMYACMCEIQWRAGDWIHLAEVGTSGELLGFCNNIRGIS